MEEGKKMIFYVDDAMKYGVEEAVLLANLRFWCEKNLANNRNIHECRDGNNRPWTYNSVKAWGKLFPYWSDSKLRRILDKLYDLGAVDKGNFNRSAYDRTLWYTVMDDKLICQDEQIDLPKSTNGIAESDEPIPDINTDSNPDINTDKVSKTSRTKSDSKHPTLDVPMNATRYQTLCGQYSQSAVDDAIQGRLDWESTNGKRPAKDYAAAAATWLKNAATFSANKSNVNSDRLMRELGYE